MGNRITGTALDDRAGCACVIRAAQLANEQNPDCCVMVLCSTKEEVGGQARRSLRMHLSPPRPLPWTFRSQSSRTRRACLPQSSAEADDRLLRGAGQKNQQKACRARKARKYPVSAGSYGRQNGYELRRDQYHPRRRAHGLISVPQRNMHTPAEICDFEDMENIAKLIAAYITDKEAQPNA